MKAFVIFALIAAVAGNAMIANPGLIPNAGLYDRGLGYGNKHGFAAPLTTAHAYTSKIMHMVPTNNNAISGYGLKGAWNGPWNGLWNSAAYGSPYGYGLDNLASYGYGSGLARLGNQGLWNNGLIAPYAGDWNRFGYLNNGYGLGFNNINGLGFNNINGLGYGLNDWNAAGYGAKGLLKK